MQNAGVGIRAVATIIDTAILFVIGYVLALFTGGTTTEGFQLTGGPFFVWLLIALAYYIAMEHRAGATAGKRLTGLKVTRMDGSSPIDLNAAIIRNVLRLVDGLFFYLVGAIFVWTSEKKQRLGDRVANTIVVRT
jgi:uncharacterized RDD family membrane protein YckC